MQSFKNWTRTSCCPVQCPYQRSWETFSEPGALYLSLYLKNWEQPALWTLTSLFSSQVGLINYNQELKSFLPSSLSWLQLSRWWHWCLEGCSEGYLVASDWKKSGLWHGLVFLRNHRATWKPSLCSESSDFPGDLWTSTISTWVGQSKLSRFPGREAQTLQAALFS